MGLCRLAPPAGSNVGYTKDQYEAKPCHLYLKMAIVWKLPQYNQPFAILLKVVLLYCKSKLYSFTQITSVGITACEGGKSIHHWSNNNAWSKTSEAAVLMYDRTMGGSGHFRGNYEREMVTFLSFNNPSLSMHCVSLWPLLGALC